MRGTRGGENLLALRTTASNHKTTSWISCSPLHPHSVTPCLTAHWAAAAASDDPVTGVRGHNGFQGPVGATGGPQQKVHVCCLSASSDGFERGVLGPRRPLPIGCFTLRVWLLAGPTETHTLDACKCLTLHSPFTHTSTESSRHAVPSTTAGLRSV